jgi:uncharacterized protein
MAARCPICSKPSETRFAPFCSKRCADVDLSRWLKGNYAIPGRSVTDEDEGLDGPDPSKSPQKPPTSEAE